jgi:FkbM family methyltransferase
MNPVLPLLFLLPYTRLELPGWGRLYDFLGCSHQNDDNWVHVPRKIIKGKIHGYRMPLDLSNWSERLTYFLGRFYELELQCLMQEVLVPGDRFVDIGANIGMISLTAAALVQESGRVDSFEPNPECVERIEETLQLNPLPQVKLHPVGLSNRADTLTLHLLEKHSGLGTLAQPLSQEIAQVCATVEVPVSVGDDVLAETSKPIKFIKIDVEGFEFNVLKGLTTALTQSKPVVMTELFPNHLQRAGTNRTEIQAFLRAFGYQAYGLTLEQPIWGFGQPRLRLVPSDKELAQAPFRDFVWFHASDGLLEKLQPFIH